MQGLVGTYQQALAHISQPAPLHNSTACSGSSSHSSSPSASAANNAGDSEVPAKQQQAANGSAHIIAAAPAGDEDDSMAAASANDDGGGCCSGSRLILWLGSSVGNYHRAAAAAFLRKLRDTMRPGARRARARGSSMLVHAHLTEHSLAAGALTVPRATTTGDHLLIGINRRNTPERVQLAYNDAAGLTRAFILNGLRHASALLGAAGGSLTPADFEYVSAVNEEAGRHEAYYAALSDTSILLPAAAVAAAQDSGPDAGAAGDGAMLLRVHAGELLHIEYSYAYSRAETLQLAADAGLVWQQAWADKAASYDVHLLSRCG